MALMLTVNSPEWLGYGIVVYIILASVIECVIRWINHLTLMLLLFFFWTKIEKYGRIAIERHLFEPHLLSIYFVVRRSTYMVEHGWNETHTIGFRHIERTEEGHLLLLSTFSITKGLVYEQNVHVYSMDSSFSRHKMNLWVYILDRFS